MTGSAPGWCRCPAWSGSPPSRLSTGTRYCRPTVRARVSVEAAVGQGWRDLVGDAGSIVSLEHFGASADAGTLFRRFGFTPESVADAARESMRRARQGGGRPGGEQDRVAPTDGGPGDGSDR